MYYAEVNVKEDSGVREIANAFRALAMRMMVSFSLLFVILSYHVTSLLVVSSYYWFPNV